MMYLKITQGVLIVLTLENHVEGHHYSAHAFYSQNVALGDLPHGIHRW